MTEQPKSIIEQVELTPLIVLQDEKKAEELFKAIKAEVAAFVYDLTTDKGRKAVASLARKIASTRTAIDTARLARTKEWRESIAAVNERGKKVEEVLSDIQDAARKPLTDWEDAKARLQALYDSHMQTMKTVRTVFDGTPESEITRRINVVTRLDFSGFEGSDLEALHDRQRATLADLDTQAAVSRREAAQKAAYDAAQKELEELRAFKAQKEAEEAAKAAPKVEAPQEAPKAVQGPEIGHSVESSTIAPVSYATGPAPEGEMRVSGGGFAAAADLSEPTKERRREVQTEIWRALISFGLEGTKAREIVLAMVASQIPHIEVKF